MNLTSKRMLQIMTVCAGACALSVTAADFASDSFEAPDGVVDLRIDNYKMVVTPISATENSTNFMWTSAAGDASKLITGAAGDSGYSGNHPIVGADQNLILNLETEGQTLSRTVGTPLDYTATTVYVDTLIKFTPSEDTPTIGSDVKMAVFVDVNSNLVVHHKTDLGFGTGGIVATNSVFPSLGIIDPAVWHRLTIQMGYPSVGTAFQIFLDGGSAITHELAYTEAGDLGGSWFMTDDTGTTLSAVAFQGTGAVDELVVTDIVPDFGAPPSILLTLAYDSSLLTVTKGGTSVGSNGTVNVSDEIVIAAADWYEIASVVGAASGTYTGLPVPGTMVSVSTGTVFATASDTLTITAAMYSGAIPPGFGVTGDLGKLAAWAVRNGKSPTEVIMAGGDWWDEYLLDLVPDAGTTQALEITKIEIVGVNAEITVAAVTPGVDFTAINGTLKVTTQPTLGGTPTTTAYPFTGTTEAVVIVPLADGKFMKAVVE